MGTSAKTTLVIPVFNEGPNIAKTIEGISRQLKYPVEVCLVYDFDEDNTLPEARKANERVGLNMRLVKNKYGRGVVNALRTGFESASTEYVVVTMADLSDPPTVINDLIRSADEFNSDIVCGSRYMRGGSQEGGPWLKSRLSRLAGLSLYYLVDIGTHDITNNFKLYKNSFLRSVQIESLGGFEVGMELVIKAYRRRLRISEVPTSWRDRTDGESKFNFRKWLPHYIKWYLYAFRSSFSRDTLMTA